MNAYCERQGHPEKSVIFLYDGEWSIKTSRASSCDLPGKLQQQVDNLLMPTTLCRETHPRGRHPKRGENFPGPVPLAFIDAKASELGLSLRVCCSWEWRRMITSWML